MANILLAEDDASMMHFITLALEQAGHNVISATNGLEALNILNSNKDKDFDLLLTDIVMPKMDGIELAKEARKICPDIKIMFITGFSAIAAKHKSNKNSDKDAKMLSKPFHLNDLVNQINQLLNS